LSSQVGVAVVAELAEAKDAEVAALVGLEPARGLA
jgi:hypothetical protein